MNLIALAEAILWMIFPFSCKDKVSSCLNVIWSVRGLALGLLHIGIWFQVVA